MRKHTILFLAANPSETDNLALDREAREIQIELERSRWRDRFELVTRWAAEPLDLLRELRRLAPTVVQFSGHGGHLGLDATHAGARAARDVVVDGRQPGAAACPGLYFQGPDGRPRVVSASALRDTFGAAGASVRLVLLNACYSEPAADALLAHVDCVVGMAGSIGDHAARSFAVGLYGGLGERESIEAAYRGGCAAIGLEGYPDADRPRLKVRPGVNAGQLVLAALTSAEPGNTAASFSGLTSVPFAPMPSSDSRSVRAGLGQEDLDQPPLLLRFVGRANEQSELTQLLEQHQAVCVEGFSGIGKTSLVLSLVQQSVTSGALRPLAFFYFDCSQRSMKLETAADFLMRSLAVFLMHVGARRQSDVLINEGQDRSKRRNALASALADEPLLLFIDNFQEALAPSGRIASRELADLFEFLFSRSLGQSRFVFASYIRCFWPDRTVVASYHLPPLSVPDSQEMLKTLGIDRPDLTRHIAEAVGCHPQALRWFSVLPREMGLSPDEVLIDLTSGKDRITESDLQGRVEQGLLERVWATLPDGARAFMARAAVYRRPVPFSALEALDETGAAPRWRQQLIERFFLTAESRAGLHYQHKLVRDFGARCLARDPSAWKDAHLRAARWWFAAVGSNRLTIGADAIKSGIEQHYHLVCAAQSDEADVLADKLKPLLRSAGLESAQNGLRTEVEILNRALVQIAPNDARAHYYLAHTLLRRGKQGNAAEFLRHLHRALELDPDLAVARLLHALYLRKVGRTDAAEHEYRQAQTSQPWDVRVYLEFARFLSSQCRDDEADEAFRRAIHVRPRSVLAITAYARFLVSRGHYTQADNEWQYAILYAPRDAHLRLAYANALCTFGKFERVEAEIQAALNLAPNDVGILEGVAIILNSKNRWSEANRHYQTACGVAPDDWRLRTRYVIFLTRHSELLKEAGSHYEYIINNGRLSSRLCRSYGRYLSASFSFAEAKVRLKALCDSQIERTAIRLEYARFLDSNELYGDADLEYKAILSSGKPSQKVWRLYAAHLIASGRYEEAASKLSELAARYPKGNKWIQLMMKTTQRATAIVAPDPPISPLQEIEARLSIKLERNRGSFRANLDMGRALLDGSRDAEAAESYLRYATQLRPEHPGAHFHYGRVLERLGRWREALAELDRARQMGDLNAEGHNARGNCLKQLQVWSESEAAYRAALASSDIFYRAKYMNNLALLFAILPDISRIQEGLELCDELAQQYPNFRWTEETRTMLRRRSAGG